MEKLKRIHVIIGAIVISGLIAAGAYFGLIKGLNEEIEKTTGEITTTMNTIEPGANWESKLDEVYPRAEKKAYAELAAAQNDLTLAMAQYNDFKTRYRHITFRTKEGQYEDVFPQLLEEYRGRLLTEFTSFIESHECTLVQPLPSIGDPPTPPIPFPRSALFPIPDTGAGAANTSLGGFSDPAGGLGGFGGFGGAGGGAGGPLTINVLGTYGNVATLLKRLPTFSRLCLIGPVTFRNLDPTTEQVEASFQITFYLVADGPPEVVKEALSGGGAGDPGSAGMPQAPGDPGASDGSAAMGS